MRLVILGLPPTTNNLYAIVAGRQVKVESGRAWTVATAAVGRANWGSRPSLSGSFAVLITYHLGAYDRDVDGSHKAILDGLSGVIWNDDRQVVLFAARKVRAPRKALPYISVVVRPLSDAPAYREPIVAPGALGFVTSVMPPSTNNTYTVFRGMRRKSEAARMAFESYRAGFERLVALDPFPSRFPLRESVRVRVRYGYTADRRDVDGSHKLLFDAARGESRGSGLVWHDDLQIISLSIAKGRMPPGAAPRIAGDVRALPADDGGQP